MEWRRHRIHLGTVHPTFVDTNVMRNAAADPPMFERLRSTLPGALGSTMDATDVAAVVVEAVKDRRRRSYAPASPAAPSARRAVVLSAIGERFLERRLDLKNTTPQLERESLNTGRQFGCHTPNLAQPLKWAQMASRPRC
jgi:hypothetical protein